MVCAMAHRSDDELHAAVEELAREFAARVTRLVAQSIADEVEAALSRHRDRAPPASAAATASPRARRRAPRADAGAARAEGAAARAGGGAARPGAVERWVPDRRARRVPNFVIEATGLKTKREIVDRFGEHAIFEKGRPAPPPLRVAAPAAE
jgi:hypothetical protein